MSLRLFDLDSLLDRYLRKLPAQAQLEVLNKLSKLVNYAQISKGFHSYLINGGFDLENPKLLAELKQVATNKLNHVQASAYLDNIVEKELQNQRSEQEIRGVRSQYTLQAIDRSVDRFLALDDIDQRNTSERLMRVDSFEKIPRSVTDSLMITTPNIFYPSQNFFYKVYKLKERLNDALSKKELMMKYSRSFQDLDPKFVAKFDIQAETWDALRRNSHPQPMEFRPFAPTFASSEF